MIPFRRDDVLKSDVFSTIERGRATTASGEVDAIKRDITTARWWALPIAGHFARREARALARVSHVPGVPRLLDADRTGLLRAFVSGLPMQLAKPHGNATYFRSAKAMLRAMRRAGVAHNDLAKEPNWLVLPDGSAGVTDFQLATVHLRKGPLFRLLAREDLRHLLKHKRTYCPEALTPSEKKLLARKSLPSRLWMATGKKVYMAVTRGLLNKRDREGGGNRLILDAPRFEAALGQVPGVTGACVVAFPYPAKGVGLYAFVEGAGPSLGDLEAAMRAGAPGAVLPEHLQIVSVLPRRADGAPYGEILKLIAMNQTDLIGPLVADDSARAAAAKAVADGRLNLSDRRIKA
jgi:hypothetical protein